MYGFLNLRSSVVRNLWAHKFQTIQANVAAPRAFVANQGFAHGRSAFASNARTPARGEWANYRETARVLLAGDVNHARYKYDADALTKLPKSYNGHLGQIVRSKAFGLSPLFTHYVNPLSMVQFAAKMAKHLFKSYIKIVCTDVVYYVTLDGDVNHLYQELMKALRIHDTVDVVGRPEGPGGLSRIIQMKKEKIENAGNLLTNAMADLDSLKKKSQKLREMARRIQTGERTLSKTFDALNLRIFEDESDFSGSSDVEAMVLRAMKNQDFILLQDLFCAVNRLRVAQPLTANEVSVQVNALQERGLCKIMEINGVSTVFSKDVECCLDSIAQMVKTHPITPLDLSEAQKISLHLAEYILLYAEREGVVTRDDGVYQVRYYHNPFAS
ncbi:vacuolar protein sorting 36 containing protein [Babesia caballi]|uniref:Vacuolar protein-sorting-associated protein 36 n=1 Tax=Babesia caballi TaxID=5871 RepID=A0AAV4LU42_BABCB|nr:vacuolar protein sorting 36 containing protein [Babesia caballi]